MRILVSIKSRSVVSTFSGVSVSVFWTDEIPIVFGLPPVFVAAALGGDIGIQEIQGLESKVRVIRCGIYSLLKLRV